MTEPTPDHKWLRSILLDPSPATFAAWSDWLREQERYEEAEIAAQGRVPAVNGSLIERCIHHEHRRVGVIPDAFPKGHTRIQARWLLKRIVRNPLDDYLFREARWVLEGDAPDGRGG